MNTRHKNKDNQLLSWHSSFTCTCSDYPLYLDITVRLVGGLTEYQGRLEVYHNGSWGTVYQDYFYYYHYNNREVYKNLAAVVCRSLGLPW